MWKIGCLVVVAWWMGCAFDEGGAGFPDDEDDSGESAPVHPGSPDRPLPPAGPGGAIAYCPDGASFDRDLDMCVDDDEAYGPFTALMNQGCQARGGGAACTAEVSVTVAGHTVYVQRWTRAMAASLRGQGPCMTGAAPDPALAGRCVERTLDDDGWSEYVYGPFDAELVAACVDLDHGNDCFLQRWPRWLIVDVLDAP